jgi:hypothetical protein
MNLYQEVPWRGSELPPEFRLPRADGYHRDLKDEK